MTGRLVNGSEMEHPMRVTSDDRNQVSRLFTLAWEKAALDGIPNDLIASTALSAAIGSLVSTYGAEEAARMVEQFADKIREGRFG